MKGNSSVKRILLDLAIILSIFWLPWWFTAILCILGVMIFESFYEFIFAGFILYSLYGVGSSGVLTSKLWLPVILIGLFFILSFIKKSTIFYNK